MNKRLAKRHKRQIARAKERVKLSAPDTRTPEQLAAAREASRAVTSGRIDHRAYYSMPTIRNQAAPAAASTRAASTQKVDASS